MGDETYNYMTAASTVLSIYSKLHDQNNIGILCTGIVDRAEMDPVVGNAPLSVGAVSELVAVPHTVH